MNNIISEHISEIIVGVTAIIASAIPAFIGYLNSREQQKIEKNSWLREKRFAELSLIAQDLVSLGWADYNSSEKKAVVNVIDKFKQNSKALLLIGGKKLRKQLKNFLLDITVLQDKVFTQKLPEDQWHEEWMSLRGRADNLLDNLSRELTK